MNMRRWILATAAALAVVASTGSMALAGPKKATREPRQQFIELGEQVFNGIIRGPSVEQVSGHDRAKFDRLARLRHSFLPLLLQSAQDPVYR